MVGHAQRRRLQAAETRRRKQEAQNNKCPLIRLPPELRMAVYDLVLPRDQILDIYGGWRYETLWTSSADGNMTRVREFMDKMIPVPGREPIMQVCRFLRSETVRYYYGHNDFELLAREDTLPRTLDWIWTRPPEVFSVLRRVIVEDMHDCTADPESPQYCSWMLAVDLGTLGLEALRDMECSGWAIHCKDCWEGHCEIVRGIQGHRLFSGIKEKWRYGEMNAERLVELVRKLRYGAKSWR